MRQLVSVVIVAICIAQILFAAQGNTRETVPQETQTKSVVATAPHASVEYIIGAQDLLDVSVWGEPQFDLKVAVRPDGKIGIKLLSDVPAGGLTTKQVEQLITEGLKPFVPNAHVTVIVLEIHSQLVTVIGNGVARMGTYPIGGPTRVLDILARAGLNDFAKKNEIIVVRDQGNNTFTKYRFDYDAFVKGNYSQNIFLRSGDIVNVP